MKRKESLKSPVKQKKSRESLDLASPVAIAVSEQRKRAKEWAESEAKKGATTNDEKDNKAKRAATPSGRTPAKKSKTEVSEVVEEILAPRSSRKSVSRSSISATVQSEEDVQPAAKSRRTPAKKAQKVEESESEQEEEPAPASKPVRKTPAKAPAPAKSTSKTPSKTPSQAAAPSAASSSSPVVVKVNTPEPVYVPARVSPAPVISRVREASPKPAATRYQEQEPEEEEVMERRVVTSSGDSLSPPNALLTVMIQVYIVVAGVAYVDAGTGFLLFLAVNVLANLVVLSSLSAEE